jgi:hypothetical protein
MVSIYNTSTPPHLQESTMKCTGSITRNGQAVARGLAINMRFQGKHWSGEVTLPKGSTLYAGGYELALSDGRKGKITISVVPPTKEDVIVLFEGEGDLK